MPTKATATPVESLTPSNENSELDFASLIITITPTIIEIALVLVRLDHVADRIVNKKLPPPTPDRCERRLFPPEQKRVGAISMPVGFA
jgi:hypothetical protein